MLSLRRSTFRRMAAQILADANEACGFLVGRARARVVSVERACFATNIEESPDQFAISPREHREVLASLEPGIEIVGIFHSHSRSPAPSARDLETMALLPLVWLIIGEAAARREEALEMLAFEPVLGRPRPALIRIEED